MTDQLNDDQQKSFIDVINFINGDEQYMDISGGAGTGKTFFIAAVADTILRQKTTGCPLHTVAITATTNKAAAVIQEAMPHRAGEIGTIYSFMNLRLSENFSTGVTKVVPTNKFEVHTGTLIIIDEDSMINAELFKYLQIGIDNTCKILFVGDRNQLAPVKEDLSPIFTQGYKTSYLTQPVRNANQPALMALCEQAKQTVLTGVFTPIVEVPGVIDFIDGPGLRGVLEREYAVEDMGRRVLSYTNKQVVLYNTFIRTLRGYTEPYEIGEILSNNSSAELAGKERLYTDQMVEVLSIVSDQMDTVIVPGHGLRTITMMVKDVNSNKTYEVTSFADPQDRADALKFYSSAKKWDRYFRIKNMFPELRSVAASTTHKAQGSTYDSVIVDLADIGKSTNRMQTARMQYVALSRPRTRLYIKGVLPDRYFK
jgi:hypothetical protein